MVVFRRGSHFLGFSSLPSGRSSESLHTSRESQRLGEWWNSGGLVTSWVLRQVNGKWMWMLGDLMWSGEVWFTFFPGTMIRISVALFSANHWGRDSGQTSGFCGQAVCSTCFFLNMGCMRLASHNDNIETLNENPGWSQACRILCFGFYRPPMAALDSQCWACHSMSKAGKGSACSLHCSQRLELELAISSICCNVSTILRFQLKLCRLLHFRPEFSGHPAVVRVYSAGG